MEQQKELYRPDLGKSVPKMSVAAWAVAHAIPHHGVLPVPYICGSVFGRGLWPQFTVMDRSIFHGIWQKGRFNPVTRSLHQIIESNADLTEALLGARHG